LIETKKFFKEYKKIAVRVKQMWHLWKQELNKCEIPFLNPVKHNRIVKHCDLKDILQQIENCKMPMPTDHVGREMCDFVRVSEFSMGEKWLMFVGEIKAFDKVSKEIEETWKKHKHLFKLYKIASRPAEKKNALKQINNGKSTLKEGKGLILDNLNELLQQTDAINWEQLMNWEEKIDN
jgi:hypothetical protein